MYIWYIYIIYLTFSLTFWQILYFPYFLASNLFCHPFWHLAEVQQCPENPETLTWQARKTCPCASGKRVIWYNLNWECLDPPCVDHFLCSGLCSCIWAAWGKTGFQLDHRISLTLNPFPRWQSVILTWGFSTWFLPQSCRLRMLRLIGQGARCLAGFMFLIC